LFGLGIVKAVLIGLNKIVSGLESLALGAFAVGVGYLVGLAFNMNNN
jgi:VIT1/CCC1 family predicted Fe2+/Mn2+ transporter